MMFVRGDRSLQCSPIKGSERPWVKYQDTRGFPLLRQLFLAIDGMIEFLIGRENTSEIPVHYSSSCQCPQRFIFTESVKPKASHVPASEHKALRIIWRAGSEAADPQAKSDGPKMLTGPSERSFLACPLVDSVCRGEFKCFGDVKGLLELWQDPLGPIKALGHSELHRESKAGGGGGRKNRSGKIRYQNGGVYLSGVMSLAHTDHGPAELLVLVGDTATPHRSPEWNKIGGTKIAVPLVRCEPKD
ncbi:hypothetical protein SRHO_G00304060 [Serrasalmus rhombeus]